VQARVQLFGHAVHPVLAKVPLALFPLVLGCDLIWSLTGHKLAWDLGGWFGMVGVGVGILAILTGTVDLTNVPPGGRAQRVALAHFFGALAVQALFIGSVWARWPVGSEPHLVGLAVTLDSLGVLAVLTQGYLGFQLRRKHGIGDATA
jgi:uncharacterized membrane protein